MLLADLTDIYLNFLKNTSMDELHKVFEDLQHVKSPSWTISHTGTQLFIIIIFILTWEVLSQTMILILLSDIYRFGFYRCVKCNIF